MKSLALVLAIASVPVFMAPATLGQDVPKKQAAEPLPMDEVPPTSAHRGLLDCLMAVNEATDPAGIKIYSLRSKVVPPADGVGELVAVEMKLGFHAASGSLAEAAFSGAQKALEALSKRATKGRHTYGHSRDGLLNVAGFPHDGLEGPFGGTHIGTLRVELPAAAVTRPSGPGAPASDVKALDPSSIAVYARSIAADAKVRFPLTVAEARRDGDGPRTWEIRPAWNDTSLPEASGLDRPRIINLMHLLEDKSRSVNITSVEIHKASAGGGNDGFRAFRLKMSLLN